MKLSSGLQCSCFCLLSVWICIPGLPGSLVIIKVEPTAELRPGPECCATPSMSNPGILMTQRAVASQEEYEGAQADHMTLLSASREQACGLATFKPTLSGFL